MPLTNAQKQQRWRERHVVVLSAPAEDIASKLIASDDLYKLHTIAAIVNAHLKDHPCPRCEGTGIFQLQQSPSCGAGRRSAKDRPLKTSEPFPCLTCRPAEYFIASGGELRAQGRYVEAIAAAAKIWNWWSVGDTMLAWRVSTKQAQQALDKA